MASRSPVKPGEKLLTNQPYTFSASMATYGAVQVNGGALFAGDSRPFDQSALNNAISKPFVVTRIKFFVGRVAGGDEVDSDYDEVLVKVSGTTGDMNYNRQFTRLSTLCDRQRREWLLQPGRMIFGWQNGGANVEPAVQNGARGAPFNLTLTFHGYLQAYEEVSESQLPQGA